MPRWLKPLMGIVGVMTLAACTDGSAPGAGCAGIKPLPAGFNQSQRVENAASARLTESGLGFLQDNLMPLAVKMLDAQGMSEGGVIKFPVPETSGTAMLVPYTLCPGGADVTTGKCVAEIDVNHAQIKLSTTTPHNIIASGPVPIRVKNLPVSVGFINTVAVISGGADGQCEPEEMTFKDVLVNANISVEVERDTLHSARLGYSKIRIPKDGITLGKDQILQALHFCPNNLGSTILNWFVPLVGDSLMAGFTDQISGTIEQMLCHKADPAATPQCPGGSNPKDGLCKYSDDTCVSMMLGMDGLADLGALMAAISPGASGGLEFLFAAGGVGARPDNPLMGWGDLNPVKNGATLGLTGGTLPKPQSECVPAVAMQVPKNIPIPEELLGNTLVPWEGAPPHVGVAVSQSFANFALGGLYNSGALCVGVSTDQVSLLHSGIISLLIPSIKYLTYQKRNQALAIVLRPQKPPTATFGTGADLVENPLVRVKLEQAMIDFYVFSSDRYVRILTGQFDFDVPINLDVSPDGLTPKLDKIYVTNPKVTNSELLKEDPQKIGKAIADVITGMAGDFLGGMQPIALNGMLAPLGVTLDLPADGLRKLASGNENYIGVFARLALATTTTSLQSDTSAEFAWKSTPHAGFRLTTHDEQNAPRVGLRVGSSLDTGAHAVEYSYRLNRGYWHMWTRNNELVLEDPALMLQGHHTIEVVSRVVGQPMSQDRTPAVVRLTMDIDPPQVALKPLAEGGFEVQADDVVTEGSGLMMRYRYDDAAWSEWVPLAAANRVKWVASGRDVSVEVKDEEGNIGTSKQALVRGRPDKNPGGGPLPPAGGCSVSSSSSSGTALGWLAGAALLGVVARRRRGRGLARALGSVGAMLLAGSWAGCTCGSNTAAEPDPELPGTDAGPDGDPTITLEPGLIGSYCSAQVASDGTVWVAGYSEADWDNGNSYGDLVVGKYNSSINRVEWEPVDGVPSSPPPDTEVYNPNGWRGGQAEPGDDVGLWTSLVLHQELPRVAYYDATNGALKYASYDGASWKTHTVYKKPAVEAGRYAKLLFVGGRPVIAFQAMGPAAAGGFSRSAVVVARGKSATPGAGSDWDFDEVDSDEQTPCRQRFCPSGDKCEAATFKCATPGTCKPDCASGTACIDGGCAPIIDNTKIDSYPDALGGYIAMAVGPNEQLGLVYYDRLHGNLKQARQDKGEWQATKILDGQQAGTPPVDTGDVGIGASLFITESGDWHVSYADGFKESLKYMLLKGGTEPQAPEVVDKGTGLGTQVFGDGQHIVGDDSNIQVTKAGVVHIAYQDATVGRLRWAVGTPESGSGHKWELKVIDQDGFAGFFPRQVTTTTSTKVVNWWRKAGSRTLGDVRLVTP
jgi:hypothetical protein